MFILLFLKVASGTGMLISSPKRLEIFQLQCVINKTKSEEGKVQACTHCLLHTPPLHTIFLQSFFYLLFFFYLQLFILPTILLPSFTLLLHPPFCPSSIQTLAASICKDKNAKKDTEMSKKSCITHFFCNCLLGHRS